MKYLILDVSAWGDKALEDLAVFITRNAKDHRGLKLASIPKVAFVAPLHEVGGREEVTFVSPRG